MALWARVQDNEVVEVTDIDPAGRYHDSLRWLPVPETLVDWVEPGWRRHRRTLAPPSLEHLDTRIAARVAERRWRSEIVRIAVDGLPVKTDAKTETRIGTVARALAAGRTAPIAWKLADGRFVDLSPEQIAAIDTAVAAHLQACFARERAILETVRAARAAGAKIAAYTASVDSGWPAAVDTETAQPETAQPETGAPASSDTPDTDTDTDTDTPEGEE